MVVVDDGDPADLMLRHQPFEVVRALIGESTDDMLRHGTVDQHVLEWLALGVGRHAEIAVGDDAGEPALIVDHSDRAAVVLPHQVRRGGEAVVHVDRQCGIGHELACAHRIAPSRVGDHTCVHITFQRTRRAAVPAVRVMHRSGPCRSPPSAVT